MDNKKECLTREVATPEELERADTVRIEPEVVSRRREILDRLRHESKADNTWFEQRIA